MKAYISPDVQAKLFGKDSPNEILKELVRWMASPSYQKYLKNRGLSSSVSWVDVFKMAVICNGVKPVNEDIMDDSDIGTDISF